MSSTADTITERLVKRFMRYSAVSSQSCAAKAGNVVPSSPGQQILAEMIADELRASGLQRVVCDAHATVSAVKPGNTPGCPRIGFICHLDTFDAGLSAVVHAQRRLYTGGDVCLNTEKDIWLRAREHPEITRYTGQEILFSDGTSVLGADDKAAVSSVMEMITTLDSSTEKHGDVVVCFVPDEEIGLIGARRLDVKTRFDVDFAFTLDCCELGEVMYECFNAASAYVTFTGVCAHPMSAKNVLVNPILMASDFMSHMNRAETPECTELREGYWYFVKLNANPSQATLEVLIRDHDVTKFAARKAYLLEVAEKIRAAYPTGTVKVRVEDVYANIANSIKGDRTAIDLLLEAMRVANVTPKISPMRGGTDGAALSAQGILTPNFFTGAHNFHSCFEFLPLPSFVKGFEVARNIVLLAAKTLPKRTASL